MTSLRPDIDLSVFERRELPPRPRRSRLRWMLPLAIGTGFVVVLLVSAGDLLVSRVDVTVVRPRLAGTAGGSATGAVLQAAGWVEPDPFPLRVPALTRGTLAELLVQESSPVRKGEPVARLVPDEANLELEQAQAALALAERERDLMAVEAAWAQRAFDAALQVDFELASATAQHAGRQAEAERLAQAARKARAEERVAEEEVAIQEELRREGSAGPRQVELARARLEAASSARLEKEAAALHAQEQTLVTEAALVRARREKELRLDDGRRLEVAKATLAKAEAAASAARAAHALALLRQARLTVAAPADGVVLERLVAPGAEVGPGESAVVTLYDPAHLRLRVDVPQEQIARVAIDQEVAIVSEARRDRPYRGTVLRVVERADNQKVTLQVHVRVEDPDAVLRPEMLCQARFLGRGAPGPAAAHDATEAAAALVPARLLRDDGRIWVVDGVTQRAALRAVTRRGTAVEGEGGPWVEVSGVNPSDKLIDIGRADLREGSRLRLRGDQQ